MNPFRERELMQLFRAVAENDQPALSLLAAADYCEERGEERMAFALREIASLPIALRLHSDNRVFCWHQARFAPDLSRGCVCSALYSELRGYNYEFPGRFRAYSTAAGALWHLALAALRCHKKNKDYRGIYNGTQSASPAAQ